jgi:hypothetical protein
VTPSRLADRLDRLRFDPRRPDKFLAARAELVAAIRMLPVPASPRSIRYEVPDPGADARVRRLAALLAHRTAERDRLQRLLASPKPKTRARRTTVAAQLSLWP